MALSSMMTHYVSMKEKYKDCILFYRLGDFYEMFFDDAVKVSGLLDLTLTGRDCGLEERAPMCGIPYHAAEGYIAKLVALGEKVAICEQLTEPTKGAKLVERDVVRVVSAGTVVDESMLDDTKNNYIACLYCLESAFAVAWADITTGEFFVCEYKGENAAEEAIEKLVNLSVAEVIANEEAITETKVLKEVRHNLLPPFSCYMPWAFNVKHAEKNLLEQFKTLSLAAYGIAGKENCIAAAGALIEYLKDTQKRTLENISSVSVIDLDEYMTLDGIAVRNLELVKNNAEGKTYGSLLWLLNKTKTSMGARLMNKIILTPLKNPKKIKYRQDGVEELVGATVARIGITETLRGIKDIERLAGRLSYGTFSPKDCLSLGSSLSALPSLVFQLSGFNSEILRDIVTEIPDEKDVVDLIGRAISDTPPSLTKDGGYIREGYNAELDELRNIDKYSKEKVLEIEAREKERTGIKTLKIRYNRVFGYYIEVSNSFKDKVPEEYIRRQTLTTGERYITEELKVLEDKILSSADRALVLEDQLYKEVLATLRERISEFKALAYAVATLDCIASFATVAKERKYCRPQIKPAGEALKISDGRHPVVEAISKERFVPNDTLLDNDENRSAIITGPNMAGKSTYMRQVALITLMAHIGSFVPARSAEIPITDRIFTRVGASDNLIFDQSTFMVEMTEVASILLHATKNSLLVLDEVGRGTSTYDGLSIAWAVIEFLTEKIGAKTLFATHYHELTELENKFAGVKNYKVMVKEMNGGVVFLRKIARGGANRSFGIEVASLAGVPKDVTLRAKAILKMLEKADVARVGLFGDRKEELEKESEKEIQTELSEVEKLLADTDVNTLSPMQALLFLCDLKEKVRK